MAKNLNGENEEFNLDNLEIHSKSGQGSNTSVESIKDIKDNKICNYISGHIFEEEIIEYLRSKLNDFSFVKYQIFFILLKKIKKVCFLMNLMLFLK